MVKKTLGPHNDNSRRRNVTLQSYLILLTSHFVLRGILVLYEEGFSYSGRNAAGFATGSCDGNTDISREVYIHSGLEGQEETLLKHLNSERTETKQTSYRSSVRDSGMVQAKGTNNTKNII